jgi:TolB protein
VLVGYAAGDLRRTDGRIVFVTNRLCGAQRQDCGRGEIAVVRADGSGATILTRNSVTESSPAWSPGGGQIAFQRAVREARSQVWLMDADGRHQRQLTHLRQVKFYGDLDWSPSGRTIVFKAFASAAGGSTDLWLADAQSGRITRLTSTPLDEAAPSWSPNGRWIAFFTEGRRLSYRIWRLSVTTRRMVQLTAGRTAALYPSWSPDSRRIAFTLGGRLAIVDSDGRHQRVLHVYAARPHWSPDGRWIVFVAEGDLYKVRPDGTRRTRVTHHGKQVVNDDPDW